jgi:hypothetical protein
VLHGRARIGALYESLRSFDEPVLIIENKLLYPARADTVVPDVFGVRRTQSVSRRPGSCRMARPM